MFRGDGWLIVTYKDSGNCVRSMRRAQTYMSCIIVLDFPLRPQHSQFSLKHRRTVKLIKVTPTKRDLDKEGVKRLASILGGREAFVRRPGDLVHFTVEKS
jgi:hypothetical protein